MEWEMGPRNTATPVLSVYSHRLNNGCQEVLLDENSSNGIQIVKHWELTLYGLNDTTLGGMGGFLPARDKTVEAKFNVS